jgi:hypothetical protein
VFLFTRRNLSGGTKSKHYLKNKMATVKEAMLKIEAHEKECAIRYQNIEKRLDEGGKKFDKLERMILGLYIAFAASLGIDKFLF